MRYVLQEEVDIVLMYGERRQSLQEKALPKKRQAKRLYTALSLAIETNIYAYIRTWKITVSRNPRYHIKFVYI